LSDPPEGGERVVLRGQAEKTGAPKLSAALNFLWLLSLFQDKESDICLLDEQKNRNEAEFAEGK